MSNCVSLSGGVAHRSNGLNGAQRPRWLQLADDRMRRRDFLALLGGIGVSWPLGAYAQQKAMPVVGLLNVFSPPANLGDLGRGPISQGLSETGFVNGQNMVWEYRWAEGHYDQLPTLAADLVSRKVDLIITIAGNPPALAAKNATSTIPIIFNDVGDPVGSGLVASLARPGGNVTGFSNLSMELTPKRLELLCELVPQATVIALSVNPYSQVTERYIKLVQEAAEAKGLQLPILKAGNEAELDTAFASLGELKAGGTVVAADGFFNARREQLVTLASAHPQRAFFQR